MYVRQFAPARWLLITVIVASFCLSPYLTFMPVYAKDILKGGADTLGILMAASGFGALSAGLYLANRKSVIGLGDKMVAGCFAAGIASAAFAYNHLLWVALSPSGAMGMSLLMSSLRVALSGSMLLASFAM